MATSAGRVRVSRATLVDVADRAGVSFATAARALGGYGSVSKTAHQRVMQAAVDLEYRPNELARALASGTTRTIGLIVGDIENPFFASVSSGMAGVLQPEGYTLLLANSNENADLEAKAVETFSRRVDGLVLAPSADTSLELLDNLDIPVVLLDRTVSGSRFDVVSINNAAAAKTGVQHLLRLGHTSIGVVSSMARSSSTAQRLRGYKAALKEAGIDGNDALVQRGSFTREGAEEAALRLLTRDSRPSAIFTTDSHMTGGALRAARRLGISIPDDLALVGFDDNEWFSLTSPSVTVIAQPVTELGQAAGRIVLDRLSGKAARRRVVALNADLIIRESCGGSRSSTALVSICDQDPGQLTT